MTKEDFQTEAFRIYKEYAERILSADSFKEVNALVNEQEDDVCRISKEYLDSIEIEFDDYDDEFEEEYNFE